MDPAVGPEASQVSLGGRSTRSISRSQTSAPKNPILALRSSKSEEFSPVGEIKATGDGKR